MAARRKGPVEAAVDRDLTGVAKADKSLKTGALAAMALALARELDDKETSAAAKAACAKQLAATITQLQMSAPPAKSKDQVDELSKRRAQRRSSAA